MPVDAASAEPSGALTPAVRRPIPLGRPADRLDPYPPDRCGHPAIEGSDGLVAFAPLGPAHAHTSFLLGACTAAVSTLMAFASGTLLLHRRQLLAVARAAALPAS